MALHTGGAEERKDQHGKLGTHGDGLVLDELSVSVVVQEGEGRTCMHGELVKCAGCCFCLAD